jgi:superoxide dismutase, Fe-Mn family
MPHHRYKLPDLPYAYNALVPTISEEIMRLHHDKHHLAYVNGANAALDKLQKARETGFAGVDVKGVERDLAFHGSGHTMHSTFWPNMKPNGGGKPGGKIADQINADFAKFDSFKEQFSTAAKQVEGSGWAILAYEPWTQQLITLQAEKHNDLTVQGVVPLLVLDVWEHAYYLQYKNDRAAYVDAWWNVVNWDDVEKRLEKARR